MSDDLDRLLRRAERERRARKEAERLLEERSLALYHSSQKLRLELDRNQRYLDTVQTVMVALDGEGRISMINRKGCELLAYEERELLGRNWFETCLPQPLGMETVYPVFRRILSGDLQAVEHVENPILCRDGQQRLIAWHNAYFTDDQGGIVGTLSSGEDITEHKQAQERLRLAATVYETSQEGMTVTDATGRIVSVNRAFSEITGYTESEVLGRNPSLLKSGRHDSEFYRALWRAIRETGRWQGEIWNRRKNGEIYPEWLSINAVCDDEDRVSHYVAAFSDITRVKESEERLEQLAHYDPLTGLPNRLLLQARLTHAIGRARREGHRVGLLYLDLDRFKDINDSLGHPAGDELLMGIAGRLAPRIRAEDTLARQGGDEFVLLLERLDDPQGAAQLAQSILHLLADPFLIAGREVYISASIGISLFPDDAADATQLSRNADSALYQAKTGGRNTYRFYTEALTRAAEERLALEGDLRRALERGEFEVYYQPQVDTFDGRLVGVEALVRWNHPQQGLVSPARFIPVAEETGLIVPLGEWVLRSACVQAKAWLDAGLPPLNLAVNLASRQFREHDLAERVAAILAETGYPAGRLELEITESAIMEQGEEAIAMLRQLKGLGVSIAIDDFGTGYSSLAYLKRFPVDKLKVDRGFIRDIPEDQNDMEIAATIIAMAKNLRLKVLAEGVETEAQLAFLQVHGCETYQGYLFSRPVPAEELEALVRVGTARMQGRTEQERLAAQETPR